jgi:hypothetical protein
MWSHIFGHTTPMPTMLRGIARHRGNVPKGSLELSRQFGSAHAPAEIREAWSGVATLRERLDAA